MIGFLFSVENYGFGSTVRYVQNPKARVKSTQRNVNENCRRNHGSLANRLSITSQGNAVEIALGLSFMTSSSDEKIRFLFLRCPGKLATGLFIELTTPGDPPIRPGNGFKEFELTEVCFKQLS